MANEHLTERDIALISHGIGVGLSLASGVCGMQHATDLEVLLANASTREPLMLEIAKAHIRHAMATSSADGPTEAHYRKLLRQIIEAGRG